MDVGKLPKVGETIVLVEDEERVRTLCSLVLRKAGYQVIEAKNGREAMDIVKNLKSPINLLLTDVVMPEMNGKEVADLITNQFPDVRVIYMSGFIGEIAIDKTDSHFLQKPFTPTILTSKVEDTLSHKDKNNQKN